jgi:hypothetical protein
MPLILEPVRGESPKVRRLRIDVGGEGAVTEGAPGRGSLLRAFGAWQGPAAADRRDEARYDHDRIECQARVGWTTWRGARLTHALVVNLSRGGACVFLDAPPPTARISVHLETPGHRAVVEARVLEVRQTARGQCTARIAFAAPCPFAVFEAAVCGQAPIDPRMRAPKAEAR